MLAVVCGLGATIVADPRTQLGAFAEAAEHVSKSIEALSAQFGDDAVELGPEYLKLAQLLFNSQQLSACRPVLAKAKQLLWVSCAPGSDMRTEVQQMEAALRGGRGV